MILKLFKCILFSSIVRTHSPNIILNIIMPLGFAVLISHLREATNKGQVVNRHGQDVEAGC